MTDTSPERMAAIRKRSEMGDYVSPEEVPDLLAKVAELEAEVERLKTAPHLIDEEDGTVPEVFRHGDPKSILHDLVCEHGERTREHFAYLIKRVGDFAKHTRELTAKIEAR